jgi:hypothetical protein
MLLLPSNCGPGFHMSYTEIMLARRIAALEKLPCFRAPLEITGGLQPGYVPPKAPTIRYDLDLSPARQADPRPAHEANGPGAPSLKPNPPTPPGSDDPHFGPTWGAGWGLT